MFSRAIGGLATFSPMGGENVPGVFNGNRIVGMSRLALVATDGLPLIGEDGRFIGEARLAGGC